MSREIKKLAFQDEGKQELLSVSFSTKYKQALIPKGIMFNHPSQNEIAQRNKKAWGLFFENPMREYER